MKKIYLLSDNAGTYSAHIFHVAVFDVVQSYGLQLLGLIHNEAQDGKTELDSSFYHFKHQLHKYIGRFKASVLTPNDMTKAMNYGKGLKNSQLDVVQFNGFVWINYLMREVTTTGR